MEIWSYTEINNSVVNDEVFRKEHSVTILSKHIFVSTAEEKTGIEIQSLTIVLDGS